MSSGFKDREHLFRVVGLFVIGIASFLAIRQVFVPSDFGRYGHYRAGALDDARARPIAYAGQKACIECHSDVQEVRKDSRHARIACETCHGPLAKHASGDDPNKPQRPDGRTICLRCHQANRAKPNGFPQVVVADHAGDNTCTECHKHHAPKIS